MEATAGECRKKEFYSMKKFIKSKFGTSYTNSTIVSRYLYTYALAPINSVNAKNGTIDIEDVTNMNLNDSSTED